MTTATDHTTDYARLIAGDDHLADAELVAAVRVAMVAGPAHALTQLEDNLAAARNAVAGHTLAERRAFVKRDRESWDALGRNYRHVRHALDHLDADDAVAALEAATVARGIDTLDLGFLAGVVGLRPLADADAQAEVRAAADARRDRKYATA